MYERTVVCMGVVKKADESDAERDAVARRIVDYGLKMPDVRIVATARLPHPPGAEYNPGLKIEFSDESTKIRALRSKPKMKQPGENGQVTEFANIYIRSSQSNFERIAIRNFNIFLQQMNAPFYATGNGLIIDHEGNRVELRKRPRPEEVYTRQEFNTAGRGRGAARGRGRGSGRGRDAVDLY